MDKRLDCLAASCLRLHGGYDDGGGGGDGVNGRSAFAYEVRRRMNQTGKGEVHARLRLLYRSTYRARYGRCL